jgi:uncharacterized membrane protein YbaN (DUF454 family)
MNGIRATGIQKISDARPSGWTRLARQSAGWVLLAVGVLGIIIPILPGLPLLVAGFALLATEYVWAHHALRHTKALMERLKPWRPTKPVTEMTEVA